MAEETPSGDAYSVVLADLRAKRAQIDTAIAAIEALSGLDSQSNQAFSPAPGNQTGGQVTAGMFHGMNIVEAVRHVLAMRKKPTGTSELTQAIQDGGVVFTTKTPGNTVSSVLNREASRAQASVISVGRGSWALPAWYPNPGRFQKKAAQGEAEAEVAPESTDEMAK